jgi:hypothetical protein
LKTLLSHGVPLARLIKIGVIASQTGPVIYHLFNLLQMKQIVFTLMLMAAAFQGYSKNTLLEEPLLETKETVLMDHFSTPSLDDCRITLRASIGFVMMEVSVSAPTCRGAFNEAMSALREAATSARDALK